MTGIVDGLGGEEVNQDVNVQTGSVIAKGPGSFAGNLFGSVVASNLGDLRSNSIDNATELFGYKVKAGSVLVGDESSGVITFKTNFADANWYITLSPRNWTIPVASNTSGTGFSVSGIRRASGCWAYGPSGTVADWIAVGM